jgi:lactate dehydrogenase-like 2-hydroxyacid dehydrogenase
MKKPKVYVSRSMAEEGLDLLRDAVELNVWQEEELMPRETQLQLFADCDGLLTTIDIKVDEALLEACPCLIYTTPSPRDRSLSRMP